MMWRSAAGICSTTARIARGIFVTVNLLSRVLIAGLTCIATIYLSTARYIAATTVARSRSGAGTGGGGRS